MFQWIISIAATQVSKILPILKKGNVERNQWVAIGEQFHCNAFVDAVVTLSLFGWYKKSLIVT